MFGQNVFTLIAVAVIFINRCADSAPNCRATVAKTTKDCLFGVIQHCGKTVCAKGSGEVCDRHPLSGDRCGLGYFCLCGRCQGCSLITLGDCFYKTTNCRG